MQDVVAIMAVTLEAIMVSTDVDIMEEGTSVIEHLVTMEDVTTGRIVDMHPTLQSHMLAHTSGRTMVVVVG